MVLAADTWGIPGPTFLWGYLALLAVALIVTLIVRAVLRSGRGADQRTDRLLESPAEIAYLNGGGELTVYAALAGLHAAGVLEPDTDPSKSSNNRSAPSAATRLRAAGAPPPTEARPLEYAVYQAVVRGHRPSTIKYDPAVSAELDAIRDQLREAGLLPGPAWLRRYRSTALCTAAVVVLGLVRLVAGIINGKPVGWLIFLIVVAGFVTVALLDSVPDHTEARDRVLKALRTSRHSLSPAMKPNWATYGAVGASLAVALFGAEAVWASAPEFAVGLGWTTVAASTSLPASGTGGGSGGSTSTGAGAAGGGDGGGCGGGGCGGCGGCGG